MTRAELIEILRQHDVAMQFEIHGGRTRLRRATADSILDAIDRSTPAAPPEARGDPWDACDCGKAEEHSKAVCSMVAAAPGTAPTPPGTPRGDE